MATIENSSITQGSSSKKRKAGSGDSADESDSDFVPLRKRSTRTSRRARVKSPNPENVELSSSAPPETVVRSAKKRKTREDNDAEFIEGSSTARKEQKSTHGDSAADESDGDFVPLRKRSTRTSRAQVQLPNTENGESSTSAPPAPVVGSSKKRKTREKDKDADFVEGSTTAKPPAKRTKTSRSARALAAPLDKGILGLAVELFCQICYELRPLDLINLSRVCTTFHSFLHGPSSTIIWRTARIANDMPDFPSTLNISEQRFAEIAFGESCHFCGKMAKPGTTMKRRIIWAIGKAVCEGCNKNTLVPWPDLYRDRFPTELLNIMPHTTGTWLQDNRFPKELADDWLRTYNALPDQEAKNQWRTRNEKEQELLNKRGSECASWLQKYKERMAKDRMDSILNELKQRGWAREMASIGSERGELRIEQNKKLKAKCQNEISGRALQELYKHLINLLEAERAKRLKNERDKMLKHRLALLQALHKSCVSQLPANSLVPSSADLFMFPAVRDLIEESLNKGKFTLAHLNSIKESFREISKRWTSEIKAKLFAMMQGRTLPSEEDDIDTVLNLATTFFICSCCSYSRDHEHSFRYKRAIMHACASRSVEHQPNLAEPFQSLHQNLHILPWNHSEKISFDTAAYHLMREVITLCGLDPDRTTAKEMDTLNPIFECLKCNSPFKGRCTMTWESAVKHHGRNGPHPVTGKGDAVAAHLSLVLLDESETELVQARMAEKLARKRAKHKYDGLCCSVCKVKGNSTQLGDAKVHKCGDVQTNRKLVPCLDHRQYAPEYWFWPPRDAGQMEIAPALDSDVGDG